MLRILQHRLHRSNLHNAPQIHHRYTIRKGGHGYVKMREAIIHSCNVYFYRLGNELGIERISRWARRLARPPLTAN